MGVHMHGTDVCAYCVEGDLAIAERDDLKAKLAKSEATRTRAATSWKKEEVEWNETFDELRTERDQAVAERDASRARYEGERIAHQDTKDHRGKLMEDMDKDATANLENILQSPARIAAAKEPGR